MNFKNTLLAAVLLLFFSPGSMAQRRVGIQDYADVTALQNETLVPNQNDKIYLKSLKKLFSWDASSVAATDNTTVVKQTNVAIGRWVLVGGDALLANSQTWTGTNTFSLGANFGNNVTIGGAITANSYRTPNTGTALPFLIGSSLEAARFAATTGNLLVKKTSDTGEALQVGGSGLFDGNIKATGTGAVPSLRGTVVGTGNWINSASATWNAHIGTSQYAGFGTVQGANIESPVIWMYQSGLNALDVRAVGFGSDFRTGTSLLTLRDSGNMGIGTFNPSQKLEVAGVAKADVFLSWKDGLNTMSPQLYFGNSTNTKAYNWQLNADGSAAEFWGSDGAWNRLMSIGANGNVGIGMTPTQKLSVLGDALIDGNVYIKKATPASYAGLALIEGNTNRWYIRANEVAESDLSVVRYSNAGAYLGEPLKIIRGNGNVLLNPDGTGNTIIGGTVDNGLAKLQTPSITLGVNNWHYSSEGQQRLFYASNSSSIYKVPDNSLHILRFGEKDLIRFYAGSTSGSHMYIRPGLETMDMGINFEIAAGSTLSATNRFSSLYRYSNSDLVLYDYDGTTFRNWLLTASIANQLKLANTITANYGGNVGIGTANPSEKLEAYGNIKANGGSLGTYKDGANAINNQLYFANFANNRAYNWQLNADGSAADFWGYGGSTWNRLMSIGANGNVGFGANTPNQKIELSTAGDVGIRLFNTTANYWDILNSTAGKLDFVRGSNLIARFDQFGLLGIGTGSPTASIHVKASNPALRLESTTSSGFLDFTDTRLWVHAGGGYMALIAGNAERMRITANGNILIGSVIDNGLAKLQTPSISLDVNTWNYSSDGQQRLYFQSNGANYFRAPAFQPNYFRFGSLDSYLMNQDNFIQYSDNTSDFTQSKFAVASATSRSWTHRKEVTGTDYRFFDWDGTSARDWWKVVATANRLHLGETIYINYGVNLGIGTASPHASAIYEVVSNNKAAIPFPEMSASERIAIPTPKRGMHVYQTTAPEGVWVYKSTGWMFAY